MTYQNHTARPNIDRSAHIHTLVRQGGFDERVNLTRQPRRLAPLLPTYLTNNQLGCRVTRRSAGRGHQIALFLVKLVGKAKVGDDNIAVAIQKQIFLFAPGAATRMYVR